MPRHEACNFIKKETLTPQVFFVNFAKFQTAPFLQTTFRWLLLTPTLVFFCEYYEIFKNTCFEKHLRTTAYWFLHKQYFTHTLQKQPPEVKISQNSQETPVPESTLLKKRLWRRCFPMNSAKFLRTPALQNTSGRLLLTLVEILLALYELQNDLIKLITRW